MDLITISSPPTTAQRVLIKKKYSDIILNFIYVFIVHIFHLPILYYNICLWHVCSILITIVYEKSEQKINRTKKKLFLALINSIWYSCVVWNWTILFSSLFRIARAFLALCKSLITAIDAEIVMRKLLRDFSIWRFEWIAPREGKLKLFSFRMLGVDWWVANV